VLLVALSFAACGSSQPVVSLTSGLEPAPSAEGERDCQLTSQRCTRCHPVERILHARVSSPTHWQRYVTRMRLMPGSGIAESEQDRIVSCLVYRSFGARGTTETQDERGI
jgi:hypothetical protein